LGGNPPATNALSRGFDNTLGNFETCLYLNNNPNPATLLVDLGSGNETKIEMVKIWARSDYRNEMVKQMTIEGSNDGTNYISIFSDIFDTGNSGNNYAGDYPITSGVVNQPASSHLDLANTIYMNNNANLFRYYKFSFIQNALSITYGSYLMAELALYKQVDNNNTQSRFPKNITIQGQQINSTTWTTLDNASLTNAPEAAGGNTLPSNPALTSLTPPIKDNFNQAALSYKKLRLVITETFGYSGNNVNIGEWVLRKRNNFTTYLGDATTPFDVNDIEVKAYFPTASAGDAQLSPDPNTFVNFNPNNTNQRNAIRDGNLSTDMDITLNTTNIYSTTANQVIIGVNQSGGERIIGLEYKLTQSNPLGEVFNHFLIYTSSILANLPFLPKDTNIFGIDEDDKQVLLEGGDLATTQPSVATDVNLAANSPYGARNGFNPNNTRYKAFLITFKSTFSLSTNRLVIPDIIVSGYDSANHIVHNTPFIGFTCRNQISSLNKYRIPRPINGEFFITK
jgi:hypothetical protein